METTTLAIEYTSDTPELNDEVRKKIEKRLQKLTNGKRGIDRAVVSIHTDSGDALLREYRVRITLYDHSSTATAIEKGSSLSATLSESLDCVERQLRELRSKKRSLRRRGTNNGKS